MYARKIHAALVLTVLLLARMTSDGAAAPPPPPWIFGDVGLPIVPGSVDVDARGVWTLRGVHGSTSPARDAFYFVRQPLSGDGSILTLLLGQEGGDPISGAAGLMFLERLAVRARSVQFQMSSGQGLTFAYREAEAKGLIVESGDQRYGPRRFPLWMRLQRQGDSFTPFISPDGFGWSQLRAPFRLPRFAQNALAGLSVASAGGGPATGVFSQPLVTPGLGSPLVDACTGTGTVLLTWPPVPGAVGYLVRRSAPSTPGFAASLITPEAIRETSFADSNLPVGQAVRYLVSAVFDQEGRRTEGWATSVTVTPNSVPEGLLACDVNPEQPQLRGSVTFDPTTEIYRITGAGRGIGLGEDSFFYASRPVQGDIQITARILDKRATAGVMLRETLDGTSRMIFLGGTLRRGLFWQFRTKAGETSSPSSVATDAEFAPPLFLRLLRRGNSVTPFVSMDGDIFRPAGVPISFDPPLSNTVYVGYAITSERGGQYATSTFGQLAIQAPQTP